MCRLTKIKNPFYKFSNLCDILNLFLLPATMWRSWVDRINTINKSAEEPSISKEERER